MAHKDFVLDDLQIAVYKRAGARSLRLSVTAEGSVRVTIPSWSPFQAGFQFARARQDWIRAQKKPTIKLLADQAIGKTHKLRFIPQASGQRITTRLRGVDILIGYPVALTPDHVNVQVIARKACIRALRAQAEQLLPPRLAELAAIHNFSYNSVNIKQLKSRWGSCDQTQNIVLNLYLVQLPWQYIDYVLLHELVHTRVLHHGPLFWESFEQVLPGAKRLRKLMRHYQPTVLALPGAVARSD